MKIAVRVSADLSPLLAYEMVKSVRKQMPHAELIHVAESGASKLDCFDSLMTVDPDGDFVDQLLKMMAGIDGNVIALDYDIILNADISDVFKRDFDICVTSRTGEERSLSVTAKSYNLGVVFSKNPEFWKEARKIYQKQNGRDGWMLSQDIVSRIIKALSGKYRVITLPGEVYNYAPNSETEDVSMRKVVHYKGERKRWMLPDQPEIDRNINKVLKFLHEPCLIR